MTEPTCCWIVSPMLRDTQSFLQLRTQAVAACGEHIAAYDVRFLVIDDSAGSDPEVDQLRTLDDVDVLTPPFNLGHQRAIVFGLRFVEPLLRHRDVVVTMDSDGEDKPEDIPRLVVALEASNSSLALAERTQRSEPLRFRIMYVIFRMMFRVLTGTTVRSGNFAAQRAGSVASTVHHPSFDLCYSSTLLALGLPTTTVPCARGHRFAGASRMNTYSLTAHGVRMLMPFAERIAVRMLVLAAISGTALAALLTAFGFGWLGGGANRATWSVLIGVVVVFLTSVTAFIVLFSGFSQSAALAMKGIGVPDPPAVGS